MKIKSKIKNHYKNSLFSRITRKVSKNSEEISRGYIVDFSEDFIILHETDDFKLCGFSILPIKQINKIQNNRFNRYYDKIMIKENEKTGLEQKTKIDISTWKSIFKSFLERKMNIIVECENPKINSFTIGPVTKIRKKSVDILYFDATGLFDKKATKIYYKNITRVLFDDRYIEIFSKYTRTKK